MDCDFDHGFHCFVGAISLSIYYYEHPIESSWHRIGYNPAGGEALADRLVIPINGRFLVFQRITPTGRAMHLDEDGKYRPR